MTGIEFEQYIKDKLESEGCVVVDTPLSNDYGADLLLHLEDAVCAVQCKFYGKSVGVKAVQEVIGSLDYYKANFGAVVTNSSFTQQAVNLAASNGVLLIENADKKASFLSTFKDFVRGGTRMKNKSNDDWNMKDLIIRYGVSESKILKDILSMDMPYYKVGREYRFKPEEVKRFEISKKAFRFGRNDIKYFPAYKEYRNELRQGYELLKANGDKDAMRDMRKLLRKEKISCFPYSILWGLDVPVAILSVAAMVIAFLVLIGKIFVG